MCSNNAPIVAIIHGQFFFSFFYFQKGFQRNQMCVINNFHKLRRSVGTQCFFTFLRHSVPTERNKRIQIYSTRITFLRNDFYIEKFLSTSIKVLKTIDARFARAINNRHHLKTKYILLFS